jgi:hypothetical protein
LPLDAAIDRSRERYTSAEVCRAAGISVATLRNYTSRDPRVIVMPDDDREKAIRGVPVLFSFPRLMQIALVSEIVSMGFGITPRRAAEIAFGFSDVGDHRAKRNPAELYRQGATLLLGIPGASCGKTVNIDRRTDPLKLLTLGGGGTASRVAVLVDPVFHRIREALSRPRGED